jgi:hypothetical protein
MSDIQEPNEDRAENKAGETVFKAPADAFATDEEPVTNDEETVEDEAPWQDDKTFVAEAPLPPQADLPPAVPEPPPPPKKRRRRRPSVFWPLVLVGAGVLLLLSNLGYVSWSSWNLLWRLWPVLLIALGVDVIIGRRSTAGALLNGLLMVVLVGGVVFLILFAQNVPAVSQWTAPAEWQMEQIAYPLDGIERANVAIDLGSVPGYIEALGDSTNLIEGEIDYTGELVFDVDVRGGRADVWLDRTYSGPPFGPPWSVGGSDRRWDVQLSPQVPLDLTIDSGSGGCTLDLSDLDVSALDLDVGSGSIDLTLPASGSFSAAIDGGSGTLTIVVPPSIGARIDLDGGSGSFRPGERFELVSGEVDDDGVWASGNWDTADYQIEITIDQGSGRVEIR